MFRRDSPFIFYPNDLSKDRLIFTAQFRRQAI
jgi:hypothetical protein